MCMCTQRGELGRQSASRYSRRIRLVNPSVGVQASRVNILIILATRLREMLRPCGSTGVRGEAAILHSTVAAGPIVFGDERRSCRETIEV